jgi:hypothetical protein
MLRKTFNPFINDHATLIFESSMTIMMDLIMVFLLQPAISGIPLHLAEIECGITFISVIATQSRKQFWLHSETSAKILWWSCDTEIIGPTPELRGSYCQDKPRGSQESRRSDEKNKRDQDNRGNHQQQHLQHLQHLHKQHLHTLNHK